MAAQRTIQYLRTAIYELLTTSPSKPRALGSTELFEKGLPPGVDAQLRSVRAKTKPRAFVAVTRATRDPGVADELGSDHTYRYQVLVSRDYLLGFEHKAAEIDGVIERAIDDFMKTSAALCWPGNLATTVAGAHDTGIAEGALDPTTATTEMRVERIGDGRDRLLNMLDRYACSFLFDPDA